MSIVIDVKTFQLSQIWSPGLAVIGKIMQFLILSTSWWIVIAASDFNRYFSFVTIFDILLIWKSNCLSRWRRIKIFDNLISEIHPIIYMLGCGNNTFIVQTNCHFYLFFKEFLWGVFTGLKNIFTFRILSSFWQK